MALVAAVTAAALPALPASAAPSQLLVDLSVGVVDVDLAAGANSITFGNASSGYAPNFDLIQIAAAVG
jgi:hypothetical protein